MRTRNYLIGVLALAVTAAIPATASATVTNQTLAATVAPTKLAKKGTPTPIVLTITTAANYSTPATDPAASLVDIDLDKNIKVNTKGLTTCDPAEIQNITTAQAKSACPASVIGSGSAKINGVLPGGEKQAVVTAFLGTPQGANPVILLHTRVDELSVTTVLTGVIAKSPVGGAYGLRLSITVPPVAGGHEVLTSFSSTIDKKFTQKKKVKGKTTKVKTGLLTSTCKTKTLLFFGAFHFKDYSTQATSEQDASNTAPCTPKKVKK